MVHYVIRTAHGYLAAQGDTVWFESSPGGWARFSTEDDARAVARAASKVVHLLWMIEQVPAA